MVKEKAQVPMMRPPSCVKHDGRPDTEEKKLFNISRSAVGADEVLGGCEVTGGAFACCPSWLAQVESRRIADFKVADDETFMQRSQLSILQSSAIRRTLTHLPVASNLEDDEDSGPESECRGRGVEDF
jgi:hypothetical protein